jgi:hypothetical protein
LVALWFFLFGPDSQSFLTTSLGEAAEKMLCGKIFREQVHRVGNMIH